MGTPDWSDDFTGTGDLNGSPVGSSTVTWQAKSGSWSRSGGLAACAAAASTSPMLVADFGTSDCALSASCYSGFGGGDALYFRVTDTSNWWRLRCRETESTSWVVTGWTAWSLSQSFALVPTDSNYSFYQFGTQIYEHWVSANQTPDTADEYYDCFSAPISGSPNRKQINVYRRTQTQQQVTTRTRYLLLEKFVAGTLTVVDSWTASSFGLLAVQPVGSTITYYEPDGVTVHGTVTDSFNSLATLHGVGKGGSDSSVYGSALDNFTLSQAGGLYVPAVML